YSNDGDVTGHHGTVRYSYDAWVVKIDSVGNIQWERSYGGSSCDVATCVRSTADSGYIFCGYTCSNDGDVTYNHSPGTGDVWVVKIAIYNGKKLMVAAVQKRPWIFYLL